MREARSRRRASVLWLCLTVRTLPIQVSDLTPAWLSGVLGLEVVDVTVLDHASATNQRVRLGLTYAAAASGPDVAVRETGFAGPGPPGDDRCQRHG